MSKHTYTYVTVKSLDDQDIEITHSDAARPPDSPPGGQYLNQTVCWVRPPGEAWVRSPHRSSMKTADVMRHINAKDIAETFLKETGTSLVKV
jgi:hypothetical protein